MNSYLWKLFMTLGMQLIKCIIYSIVLCLTFCTMAAIDFFNVLLIASVTSV